MVTPGASRLTQRELFLLAISFHFNWNQLWQVFFSTNSLAIPSHKWLDTTNKYLNIPYSGRRKVRCPMTCSLRGHLHMLESVEQLNSMLNSQFSTWHIVLCCFTPINIQQDINQSNKCLNWLTLYIIRNRKPLNICRTISEVQPPNIEFSNSASQTNCQQKCIENSKL